MKKGNAALLESLILKDSLENFYFNEAELLDDRKYNDWFALFCEDMRYFMPLRTNRTRRDLHLEYTSDNESAYFDEDHNSMSTRIRKFYCGGNWAEDPPSRTRHLISNVRVVEANEDQVSVKSAFIVYRNRLERQTEIFAGERLDTLMRVDDTFRISRRTILLDQSTLLTSSLSFFF